MRQALLVVTAASLWAAAGTASALEAGVKAGTLGLGVELSGSLSPAWSGRVVINRFDHDTTRTEGNIDYDGKLRLQSGGLLLDWHPWRSGFRASLGYLVNDNELRLTGRPSGGSYDIGGVTYSAAAAGTVSGRVRFRNGPYLGVGWDNARYGKGWSVNAEAGVLYQGQPRVSLSATGAVSAADIAREEAQARDSLKNFKYYPVLSFGLSYGF